MKFIPVNEPLLVGNERSYLNECLDTGYISSEGHFVERFEREFAASVGRNYGIAVCNGTAALDVAVTALQLGAGDEVILPTFTIISCAASVVRAGATPVVIDSDPVTWNVDVTKIEKNITPHTKAIMVVHMYGLPVDMDPVVKLAEKYNLKIIEDAAEVIGQRYRDRNCGCFGEISAFSFYANKHITTGEGGMVLTDDKDLADRCRRLRNLCFLPERRFVHEELGWNYRMTNLQAALGVAQLEALNDHLRRKREIGLLYSSLLNSVGNIELPVASTSYANNLYWVYGIVLKEELPADAASLIDRLHHMGVGCRPFFWPMHEQPVFRRMGLFSNMSLPVSERLARRGLYLPSGLALTDEQVGYCAEALKCAIAGL